jgi:hypothetical protein
MPKIIGIYKQMNQKMKKFYGLHNLINILVLLLLVVLHIIKVIYMVEGFVAFGLQTLNAPRSIKGL